MRVTDRPTTPTLPVVIPVRSSRIRTLALVVICSVVAAGVSAGITAVLAAPGSPAEFRQVFREDFSTAVPAGRFPGTVYGAKFSTYPDGWADTNGRGEYRPSEVLSVVDGALNWDMKMEGGKLLGAAVLPTLQTYGQTYGQYSLRFRAESSDRGFGLAFLLWPDSEKWPRDGEIDFPEGELQGEIYGYAHHAGESGAVDKFATEASFNAWHVATIEWRPGSVRMLLDGELIGESTRDVPTRSMHWVLQTGSSGDGFPGNSDTARVQVDWMEAATWEGTGA